MDVELAVFSEADTGTSTARSDHATRVGQVRDTLLDDAIETTLSDDANLKVFFVAFGEIEDGVDKNRAIGEVEQPPISAYDFVCVLCLSLLIYEE